MTGGPLDRAWPVILSLLVVALGGCVGDSGRVEGETPTTSPTGTNETANRTLPPGPPKANLTAQPENDTADPANGTANGTAPLTLTFNMTDDAGNTEANWTLDFGDGNDTEGEGLPADWIYMYSTPGNYTVTFSMRTSLGEKSADTVTIKVEEGASGASQTEFTGGPFLGCATELGPGACGAVLFGPEDGGDFGLWIPLEPGHIGMSFAVTTGGDSDAWIFADPGDDPIAEGHNSGDPAAGVIPEGAQWLLAFPWVEPTDELTVVFTPAG